MGSRVLERAARLGASLALDKYGRTTKRVMSVTRGTQIEMESEKPDAGAGRHKRQVRQDTGIFGDSRNFRERGFLLGIWT